MQMSDDLKSDFLGLIDEVNENLNVSFKNIPTNELYKVNMSVIKKIAVENDLDITKACKVCDFIRFLILEAVEFETLKQAVVFSYHFNGFMLDIIMKDKKLPDFDDE